MQYPVLFFLRWASCPFLGEVLGVGLMVNVSIDGIKFASWILRNNFLGVKLCVAVLSLILGLKSLKLVYSVLPFDFFPSFHDFPTKICLDLRRREPDFDNN